MRVLLSGGGTAGHIYPALTVAAKLAAEHNDVAFVGTPDGLEARLVPEAGVVFHGLRSKGFDRGNPLTLVVAAAVTIASTLRAWRWMGRWKPDVVMGFGGYVSLPVGLATVLRRIPLILHEQNSVPGLANRILSRWADSIGVTYQESVALLPRARHVELTGNPVRAQVLAASRESGRRMLGLSQDDLALLVFGGSRGARHLNEAVVGLKERLLSVEGLIVIQVAGTYDAENVREQLKDTERWQVHEYITDMGNAIAAADLVVCRAGATTIAELTSLGAASILVPYPYATGDHQTKNAAALVSHGAALLVPDAELDSPAFADELLRLLGDARARANMAAASRALAHTDAAQRLAVLAHQAAQG